MIRILQGDCRDVLRTLPDASIQMVCTSPPYFNLRSYLPDGHPDKASEFGLETTPDEYVSALVGVFQEIRRVLREDGTVFLNLGDSFCSSAGLSPGLKPKDLIGIPWMVAFALRSDGWWLRADNIWGKPNGMPESTTDRTTRAHEYVFLLSKSERYYYDHEAVRTAPKASTQTQLAKPYLGESTKPHEANGVQNASDIKRRIVDKARKPPSPKYVETGSYIHNADIKARYYDKQRGHSRRHDGFNDRWDAMERADQMAQGGNLRSVWWISPAQYAGAHFAVMPSQVAEICIRAGSKPGDTILDPFSGTGTTALVADRLGRNEIGIELNPTYAEMSRRRVAKDAGLFAQISEVA